MKRYLQSSINYLVALLIISAFIFSSFSTAYAAPDLPQIIKVGLSYSNAANDNFIIRSDSGMKISIKSTNGYIELFSHTAATGFKIRKDSYYNIVNSKETEINYVKGAVYSGELVGSYHIQIGDVYPDINSAKLVADSMTGLSNTVYFTYDNGWKVWAQLYLDEGECQTQIQLFKKERPEYTYSIIAPDKKRVQLFDEVSGKLMYILNAEQDIKFEPITQGSTTATIAYNALKYRGSIFIKRFPAGFVNVYNELPFEEYLYAVVPSEMPALWHMEAIKAQAVASRNYGIQNMGKHKVDGFDVCSGVHCQAYGGYNKENIRTNQAVDETKGKLILYNDNLITAYYHSSSGGRTENSENIWSSPLPYAKSVDDNYGLGSPHDNWIKKYSKDDIKQKLMTNQIDVGDIIDIVPLEYSVNGRVTMLEVRGTKGSSKLAKEKIRSIMGSTELKSIWYTLSTDADLFVKDRTDAKPSMTRAGSLYVLSAGGIQKMNAAGSKVYVKDQSALTSYNVTPSYYIFTGKGFGHGIGMSQYGAKGMAEAGFNFIQILEYYYTGTKVK